MTICVLDTETTGLDPESADIVELGIVRFPEMSAWQSLVKPTFPIELKAMATHHIKEAMLFNQPDLGTVFKLSPLYEASILVAHNAEFDRGFIEKPKLLPDMLWVCTWRCARHLWPDAPFHSNQVLRYWLEGLDDELYRRQGKEIMRLPPHRALPDAWVTAHILKRLLIERSIGDLIELTKQPILGTTCGFGKHRGVAWGKVPKPYLRWMLNQKPGFDDDTVFTVKHYLEPCPDCSNGCDKCNKTGFKYQLPEDLMPLTK